jgi:hypothetical protein
VNEASLLAVLSLQRWRKRTERKGKEGLRVLAGRCFAEICTGEGGEEWKFGGGGIAEEEYLNS